MSDYIERLAHNLRVNLMTEGATVYTVTEFINSKGLNLSVDEVGDLITNRNATKYWMLWKDAYLYIDGLFEDGVSP